VSYQLEILPEAAETIRRLDNPTRRRIIFRLNWLSLNFDTIKPQRLTGKLRAMYKLRAGDYRVLYSVDYNKRLIIIHRIGHRRDVYED